MEQIEIAEMKKADLQAVIAIQEELFTPDLQEDISILRHRCELFPQGCWVIKYKGDIVGYLVSNPWTLNNPPKLGSYIQTLPDEPNCIYLHDVGISRCVSGKGLGSYVFNAFKEFVQKSGFNTISLVAVMNARSFWQKHGFTDTRLDEKTYQNLVDHYGSEACYMTMTL